MNSPSCSRRARDRLCAVRRPSLPGAFFGSKLSARRGRRGRDGHGWCRLLRPDRAVSPPVLLVPSPAFRSMALGIMLSVVFVLATLTLLPAGPAKLGRRVDRLALPWVHAGEHRSPAFARWAGNGLAPPGRLGSCGRRSPRRARPARVRARHGDAVDQGRARGRLVPPRLRPRAGGVRARRPGRAPGRRPPRRSDCRRPSCAATPESRASPAPASRRRARCSRRRPHADPSDPAVGETIDRLRDAPQPAASSAARRPRTTTSRRRCRRARRSWSASCSYSASCCSSCSRCRRP